MVITQVFFAVIATRVLEFFIVLFYSYIEKYFLATRERKNPEYKKLSADCSLEFHKEVSDMAKLRCITIKEYIIGAILTRLKYDTACLNLKV